MANIKPRRRMINKGQRDVSTQRKQNAMLLHNILQWYLSGTVGSMQT